MIGNVQRLRWVIRSSRRTAIVVVIRWLLLGLISAVVIAGRSGTDAVDARRSESRSVITAGHNTVRWANCCDVSRSNTIVD